MTAFYLNTRDLKSAWNIQNNGVGSAALPFGCQWYGEPDAMSNGKFYSRSPDAMIRVYDHAGNVIETHEHAGEFKEP
jgi:hypothetical protein